MANYGGEAANYYNQQPASPPNMHQTQAPQQDGGHPVAGGPQYHPPPYPPQVDQKLGPPPTYDEIFAVQKPKWNDVWAGLLFLATCAGFVVVSGFTIQGYGTML